ncbi:peptidoglycan-recognition protein 1-like [Oppia nitens]|uniref:peptidoglycan-recognition protein 1-like n=1 Tax=Oppia nitens TaxID=1686743 RepID=UPI0023DC32A0|nr:peptidoglycan-recognition protein 1-like [Oppia nitens]
MYYPFEWRAHSHKQQAQVVNNIYYTQQQQQQQQAQVCNEIQWVSRNEWAGRPPRQPAKTLPLPVGHAFIHHTVSPLNCLNHSSCIQAVKWAQNLHMDGNGWDDIGYNFLLGGDHRIYIARGWSAQGSHTLGMNDRSINLAFIGNYDLEWPTAGMLEMAQKWLKCSLAMGILTPDYQLHGHRDQSCLFSSPGQHVYDLIKQWPHFLGGPLPTSKCYKSNITTTTTSSSH